ncbi:MAG TPA: aminopeptidase [Candidatus Baltobacteraceae bacterium]|jgi:predicted aminopeptidase|nr:aminopeptidase [Candidatus Baltobacteraceae bacterium]
MAIVLSGCEAVGYYRQAIAGEYQILAHQKPIESLIANPATPAKLKAQFKEVLEIRRFAGQELKEPVDKSYVKYTDLHRSCVVWTVVVAPPLSLEPKTWWFPVVGRASYRGYFNESSAERYAEKWEKRGWDVDVGGVQTYSTLGWFHDPLLSTFIYEPESELAEIIFHELGHRRLFIPGDTDFNEAFATTVAEEGVRRWYLAAHKPEAYEDYLKERRRENDFVKLVLAACGQLQALYSDSTLPDAEKLRRKEEVIGEMRENYAKLKTQWGVTKSGYDYWFSEPINNAKLNTIATYYDLVPGFQAVLKAQGGDIEKFYQAVGALAKLPLAERHEALAHAAEN